MGIRDQVLAPSPLAVPSSTSWGADAQETQGGAEAALDSSLLVDMLATQVAFQPLPEMLPPESPPLEYHCIHYIPFQN